MAQVRVRADGGFTYDPTGSPTLRALETGESLQDTFTYQARDDGGAVGAGTVLVIVGGISDPPYQNAANHFDVNGDGIVSPIDALILINYINANPGQVVIPPGQPTPPYLDVDGKDNAATPNDVFLVVNALNAAAFGGSEGEGASAVASAVTPRSVTATPAQLGVSSFSTLSYAQPARELGQGASVSSRSTASDLSLANAVCLPESRPVTDDPHRAVFDDWSADDSELDDALATMAQDDSREDREAATDALLGSLFA